MEYNDSSFFSNPQGEITRVMEFCDFLLIYKQGKNILH